MTQPLLPSEGFSDSDEVFPKEMTKWNSNDFIDAFASPMEAEGAPGKDPAPGGQPPAPRMQWGLREQLSPKFNEVLRRMAIQRGCLLNTRMNTEWVMGGWMDAWLECIHGSDTAQRMEELIWSPGRLHVGGDV